MGGIEDNFPARDSLNGTFSNCQFPAAVPPHPRPALGESNGLRFFPKSPNTFSLRAGAEGERSRRAQFGSKEKTVLFCTYGFVVVTEITNNNSVLFLYLWKEKDLHFVLNSRPFFFL